MSPASPRPLSFVQEHLWFLDRLEPGRATYNIPSLVFRMRGHLGCLEIGVLRRTLDELARRHDAFRTTFGEVDGRPVQTIEEHGGLPLPLVDLESIPGRDAEARALAGQEATRPFDLSLGPLSRALLVRIAPDEHLFLLVQHHIISDGWSVDLLLNELTALYGAFREGSPTPLPGLILQPADLAARQRERLQGPRLDRLLAWWTERLAGSRPLLDLPADRPRPAVRSVRGATVRFPLGREAGGLLRERIPQATPFMVFFAAFQALLFRLTGRPDLLVGFPVAGRGTVESERVVGFLVNTLVLRTTLADDPPFSELVQRLREGVLDALDHQEMPFERLVDELQPERGLSHSPLVQVMFTYRPAAEAETRLPGLVLIPETVDTWTSKLDLTLGIGDGSEGFSGTFEYSADLFEPTTVQRMSRAFQLLVDGALHQPQDRLSDLPLLDPAERHQLLVEWNDTRRQDPRELIHALFLDQVRRRPDAPALSFGETTVTYGELAARAERLANRLRSQGVGPDVRVGVSLERSPELIVALLGVLMAGGAYVPVDPAMPAERREALLEESGVRVVIGDAGDVDASSPHPLAPSPVGRGGTPALLESGDFLLGGGAPSPGVREGGSWERGSGGEDSKRRPLDPDNLAYILFTSGSTGRPKSVGVSHRAVVRLVRDAGHASYAAFGPEQVFLQLSTVSFDASTFEIWGCLLHGGRLVIAPPGLPSLAELGALIRRERVTTLWLTAGLFHSMMDSGSVEGVEGVESVAGLTQLLAGGDVLSPAHVRRALQELPGVRLINGYGPTESTTFACCHTVTVATLPTLADVAGEGSIPIGRPIGNTTAYVVDRWGRPAPIGIPGDLLLGGDGLARGYLNDPALTAERFVPNALSGSSGARLYRTGDQARVRPDGLLEFLGRIDQQLKIRGFRIEPAEIEAALAEHPAVGAAAVVAEGRDAHSRRLVAFVAPRAGVRVEPRALREWLKQRLPLYMVPAALVALDALPLTANGKVDRRSLEERARTLERVEPDRGADPPRTELERKLAGIWAELLRVESVGRHDNFFDLGGDSLLAIQMAARASRAGIDVTLRQLFRHQTVAELAADLDKNGVETTSAAVRGEPGWVTGPVPMTPGQVWFFDRVAEHLAPHQFSNAQLLELREPIPAARVIEAAAWMLFQHDALRLRVSLRNGVWEQHNAGPEALHDSIHEIDLTALPPADRDAASHSIVRDFFDQRDLEGPLARFVLLRPNRLLAVLHHLVSDAASWRLLREDLETALAQASRDKTVRLPAKTTSFRAWALRQADLARSAELRGQVDLWLDLAQKGSHPLPADFPDGDPGNAGTGEVGSVRSELDEDETRRLLQAPVRGGRFTDALLAAVTLAIQRWTGSGSVLLRQSLHGRDPVFEDVDLSRTLGWIATTAPVLLELSGAETPAEALASVAAQIERVPLRGLGYGVLRYMTGDPEIEARMATVVAAPAATFNFIGRFEGEEREDAGLLRELPLGLGPGKAVPRRDPQLRIASGIVPGPRLVLTWHYGTDFYRPETIERLAAICLEELRKLVG